MMVTFVCLCIAASIYTYLVLCVILFNAWKFYKRFVRAIRNPDIDWTK